MLRSTIFCASMRAALMLALSFAGRAAEFEVDWARVSAGTTLSHQAGTYEISGTIGQHDAGEMSGCCTGVQGGFWVVTLPSEAPPVISEGNANLLVQIKESADPLRLGGFVTYTLIVSNQGPATASNVLLTNLLPSGMELVSAASLRPLTISGAEISAQIQQIHVNACAEVQILARGSTVGLHTNSASVIPEAGDLYTQDNVAAETTAVLNREPKTFNWVAALSSDWENAGNWFPLDGPPTLGDTAIIQGNTPVVLNQNAAVSKVLLAANLEGAGDLLVASEMSWQDGLIQGAGTIQILPGAVLKLEGASSKRLMRGLNNFGTIIWSGSGLFQGFNGPLLRNFPGASFVIETDAPLTRFNAGMYFENAGTLRKFGSGPQSIEAYVNNTGMIAVEGGELTFISTFGNQNAVFLGPNANLILGLQGTNQGSFHLAPGSSLRFRGATHALEDGASISGAGFALVESGVLHAQGASRIENLSVIGGELRSDGITEIPGTLQWTGGIISGNGTNRIASGATLNINGDAPKRLMSTTLENAGTINWDGAGNLTGHSGPVVNNLGEFNWLSPAALLRFNAGLLLNNSGTVRSSFAGVKSAEVTVNNQGQFTVEAGELSITSPFDNHGTVELGPESVLALTVSGTSSGAFNLAAGSNLRFGGGTHYLEEGSVISGAGVATVYSGFLHARGRSQFENVAVTAGEFLADTVVDLTGGIQWTGGTIGGEGIHRLAESAVMDISGDAQKTLRAATLENLGTINWRGAGALSGFNGPVVNNLGEFNWLSPAALVRFNAGLILNNSGTVRSSFAGVKSAEVTVNNQGQFTVEAGELSITSPFDNHGTVELGPESVLALTVSGTSSGAFNLAAGSNLRWGGGTHYLEEGSVISGAGLATIYSGFLHARGSSQLENVAFTAGEFLADTVVELTGDIQWTGGIIGGAGMTRLTSGATLNIVGEGQKVLRATTLENSGTINWSGTGALQGNSRPIIRNLAAGTFNALSDAPLTRFNAGAIIENEGIFRRAATGGTKTMDAILRNGGTLELGVGTLRLLDAFTNTASGEFNVAIDGLTAATEYAQLDVRSPAQIDGTLSVNVAPGFVPPIPAAFQLITATAITGTFAQTTGLRLPGVEFVPRYSATTVSLETAEAPPLPPLRLEMLRQDSALLLDWPAEYSNVVVESAETLTDPDWVPIEVARGVPFPVADTNQTVFFRLRVP